MPLHQIYAPLHISTILIPEFAVHDVEAKKHPFPKLKFETPLFWNVITSVVWHSRKPVTQVFSSSFPVYLEKPCRADGGKSIFAIMSLVPSIIRVGPIKCFEKCDLSMAFYWYLWPGRARN